MECISGDGYEICYDSATTTIAFHGSLRLLGASGYDAIPELQLEIKPS